MSDVRINPRQLTREDFTAERVKLYADMMRQYGIPEPMSEEAREQSRQDFLTEVAVGEDVWVFGYGSLMWNPAIKVAESRIGRICGYSRRFCLTLSLGRGTPENPGLMLALDQDAGGACAGVAHRIESGDLDSESKILWYREMISGAYQPRWLDGEFIGGGSERLLTFVVRRDHARYEANVPSSEQVRRIAQAEGVLGTNRDYLYRTAEFLAGRGIAENWIVKLADEVRTYRIQQGVQP